MPLLPLLWTRLPAILTPAEEEVSLLEELSKDVKRYEPLWSISEFFRMKPSPGLPIPWLALWWSLALRTCSFVPSPLMAPPHAGAHLSPPPAPLMLRDLIVTRFAPLTSKALSAPLACICGRDPSE